MSKQGFIQLHRRIQDHWLYQEKRKFSKFEAWVDLLMMASHKDNKFLLGNELIEIKRGQFITSELKLMEKWGWGKSKTRDFLKLLETDGMIVKKSDRKKTTITICNYSHYHDKEKENRPIADHKQTDSRPIADTINNVKNVKNVNKDTSRSKLKFETHHYQLAKLLFNEMRKNNESVKKPNLESWANTFRLMMERDGRSGKQIQDLIIFSQNHDFWHKNIMSPEKLRKQFDRLLLEKDGVKENKIKVAKF